MRTREAELTAAGARLVFVGTGSPAMASDFARTHAGPHAVLTDPQRRAFAAAGMKRGLFSLAHWRLLINLWRAFRRGFRQGRVQGDPWQQGGVLVVNRARGLVFEQRDAAAGDAIALDAIVRAAASH